MPSCTNTRIPGNGSLRSRGAAAAVSSLTLRQISAVLPAGQAWGLWVSRQIVARAMDTFGPSLAGTHVISVDTRTSDGRRVVGEWVYGAGVQRDHAGTAIYFVHGSGYGAEMLAADATTLADDIRSAGGACELEVWPDQVHVFQALPRLTPEARPAMSRIAAFITQGLRDKTIQEAAG